MVNKKKMKDKKKKGVKEEENNKKKKKAKKVGQIHIIQSYQCSQVENLTTPLISYVGSGVPQEVLDMPVDPNEPTYCTCQQVKPTRLKSKIHSTMTRENNRSTEETDNSPKPTDIHPGYFRCPTVR